MSEYIVDFDNSMAMLSRIIESPSTKLRGQIVRCRDCKYSHEERRDSSIGWVNELVCVSEQWSTSSLMPSHKVDPDGFCKWAGRREDKDAE